MTRLDGRTALVTGAGKGIGAAVAERLARNGARVAVNFRSDEAAARQTVERIEGAGAQALPAQGDVSREADVGRVVRTVVDAWGRLDILVNNAGVQVEAPSHELALEDWEKVIGVDLRGTLLCSRAAIRRFLEGGVGGVIVNVSSVHEIIPRPRFAAYAAAKGGVGQLTRTLALEYAHAGIRVNAVGPGAVETRMNREWAEDPEKKRQVESHIPMGRVAQPDDVAAVVAFLAGDEAAYVTGQTVFVDGGLTLYADFRTSWSS